MEGKIVTVIPRSSDSAALVSHRGPQMQIIKITGDKVMLGNPEPVISWTAWLRRDEAEFLVDERVCYGNPQERAA